MLSLRQSERPQSPQRQQRPSTARSQRDFASEEEGWRFPFFSDRLSLTRRFGVEGEGLSGKAGEEGGFECFDSFAFRRFRAVRGDGDASFELFCSIEPSSVTESSCSQALRNATGAASNGFCCSEVRWALLELPRGEEGAIAVPSLLLPPGAAADDEEGTAASTADRRRPLSPIAGCSLALPTEMEPLPPSWRPPCAGGAFGGAPTALLPGAVFSPSLAFPPFFSEDFEDDGAMAAAAEPGGGAGGAEAARSKGGAASTHAWLRTSDTVKRFAGSGCSMWRNKSFASSER